MEAPLRRGFPWLDAFEEAPPEDGEPEPAECDLHDLFAEFAALRQEVRLQNREQSRAGRELAKAAAVYETAAALAQRREEDLATLEIRVSRAAEDRCLRAVLEVRDALVRGGRFGKVARPGANWTDRAPARGDGLRRRVAVASGEGGMTSVCASSGGAATGFLRLSSREGA